VAGLQRDSDRFHMRNPPALGPILGILETNKVRVAAFILDRDDWFNAPFGGQFEAIHSCLAFLGFSEIQQTTIR
jgi:hypothetical protein